MIGELHHCCWRKRLSGELAHPYMLELSKFLMTERSSSIPVYPAEDQVFAALNAVPFDKVSVVIVGQDPYHGPGQAHGYAFSVPRGIKIPPSLRNINKELQMDLGVSCPGHGDLSSWASQGALLLNTTLTVRQGAPKSHFGQGWERFTDAVIDALCQTHAPIVFMLWGRPAKEKAERIIGKKTGHYVLAAPHPSPLSAYTGFLGCGHFSRCNAFLEEKGRTPINWDISA
jgi:uracil-DNA glycosylase